MPVIGEITIGEFLGIFGLTIGPLTATVPDWAPPTVILPLGFTVLACRSMIPGLFEAAFTVVQVMVTVSPTFGEVLELVTSAIEVPWTVPSPTPAGGMQVVAKLRFAATAG